MINLIVLTVYLCLFVPICFNMIRLLNAETCQLPDEDEMKAQQGQPYVIISHAWLDKEVVFADMPSFREISSSKWESARKITGACKTVLDYFNQGVKYLWLDTVCIDKKNLTEYSMAINSMYNWYRLAKVCFVYLQDIPSKDNSVFTGSKWFTRGWTFQE